MRYVSLRQTHGEKCKSGSVMVAPGADAQGRPNTNQPPRILMQDTKAHAVESVDQNVLAVAAFAPAIIPERIRVDRPAFVLLGREGERVTLAIACPAQSPEEPTAERRILVEIPGVLSTIQTESGATVSPTYRKSTQMEILVTGGATRTVMLKSAK